MKLYKSAKYISSRDNIFVSGLWKEALFEICVALFHPNYYFHCNNIYIYHEI